MRHLRQHSGFTIGWWTRESGFNPLYEDFLTFYMGNSENNISHPKEPLHMKKINRPEKVAGRKYNSIISKLLSRKFSCKNLLQFYALDLHILTPLTECQFTVVFNFLAVVQNSPLSPRR